MTSTNNRQKLGPVVEDYDVLYLLRDQNGYLRRAPCLLDGDSVLQVSDTLLTALDEKGTINFKEGLKRAKPAGPHG